MALFDQFPYTDFHELNADWLLKTVKTWSDKYTDFETALKALEVDFDDLREYVDNFIDDLDIQTAINNKLEEMYINGDLQTAIAEAFLYETSYHEPAVIAENIVPTGYGLQGAAFCKRGASRIMVYYIESTTNTGKLIAFDLDSYTPLWEISILAYHGNSITYRPADDCLYIASCKDVTTNADTPYIIKVPMSTPGAYTQITLPGSATAFSCVYDNDNDNFIVQHSAASPTLTVYDNSLTNVIGTIALTGYIVTGEQGVQACQDGIIYAAVWRGKPFITGHNISDGKRVKVFNVPDIVAGYKKITELEALTIDDKGNMLFAAAGPSFIGNSTLVIGELPIKSPVVVRRPFKLDADREFYITCTVNDLNDTYAPGWELITVSEPDGSLKEVADLNAVAAANGYPVNAAVLTSGIAFTKYARFTCSGVINFQGGKDCPSGISVHSAALRIARANITGGWNYNSSIYCGLAADENARVTLNNCTINILSGYPLYAGYGAEITALANTTITKINGYDGKIENGGSIKRTGTTPATVSIETSMGAQVSRLATNVTFTTGTPQTVALDGAGSFTLYRAFYNGSAAIAQRSGSAVRWLFATAIDSGNATVPGFTEIDATVSNGSITVTNIRQAILAPWAVSTRTSAALTIDAIKTI